MLDLHFKEAQRRNARVAPAVRVQIRGRSLQALRAQVCQGGSYKLLFRCEVIMTSLHILDRNIFLLDCFLPIPDYFSFWW